MKNQSRLLAAGLLAAASTLATLGLSPPAMAQEVTLRMATWLPDGHHLTQSLKAWAAQIEEASGDGARLLCAPMSGRILPNSRPINQGDPS